MKTTLSIFCVLFSLNAVFAQLYVKDTYVFNQGAMIYVKDYVELNTANSNIYLRNEGQLLQGSTVANGLNRGIGSLSVFQEGTANNFGYNYWCSPVGVPAAATGNNSFVLDQVVKRPTSNIAMQVPTFTSSFNGTSTNAALSISNKWTYTFTAANNYSQWNYVGQSGTVPTGLGFTLKGVSGDDTTAIGESTVNNPAGSGGLNDYQRYDFRGKANDGTISFTVAAPTMADQYPNSTLTGNPYPSAINLNLFLLEHSGYTVNYTTGAVTGSGPVDLITGNAFYWEHQKPATSHILLQYIGGYGYYAPNNTNAFSPGTYNSATWNTYNIDGSPNTIGGSTGSTYLRMFCPVGQGFMVSGKVNSPNVQMKNIYRAFVKEGVANNSQFERNANTTNTVGWPNWDEIPNVAGVDYTQFSTAPTPQIKIHTIFNNLYTKETTMAFNPNTTDGFDSAMDVASYEANLINDSYFSIVNDNRDYIITTLPYGVEKRIPYTFKAGEQATFKVTVGDFVNFDTENVYMYDGLTGIYHDIKNGFFEITLPAGTYANRFEITFRDSALSIANPIKENVTIVQNNANQQLVISNPNMMDIKAVTLFDITGKQIFNKINLGSKGSYEFSTSSLAAAVYLVKVQTTDGQSLGQKIIVATK